MRGGGPNLGPLVCLEAGPEKWGPKDGNGP